MSFSEWFVMIIYAFKEMPLLYILRIFIRYSLKSRVSLLEGTFNAEAEI